MLRGARRLATGLSAILSVAGSVYARAASSGETVIVHLQWPGPICAGICPWFETTVGPDSHVASRLFVLDDKVSVRRMVKFRVTAAELAEFTKLLRPFRPAGTRRTHMSCTPPWPPQHGDTLPAPTGIRELDIRWNGGRHPAHLIACYSDWKIHAAVGRALAAIAVSVHSGDRMSPGQKEAELEFLTEMERRR